MKKMFRRNQIIITTLAIMIAAAGYLNYSAKQEVAGVEVYEAGMMEISDEDILAENQARHGVDDGSLVEIMSLDSDGAELPVDTITGVDQADASGNATTQNDPVAQASAGTETTGAAESGTGAENTGSAGAAEGTWVADSGSSYGNEASAAGIENPGEAVLTGGTTVSEYIAGVQLDREQIRAKNKETMMELINSDQIPDVEKQAVIQNMIRMTEISEKENAAETLLKAKGFIDPIVSITEGQVDVVINAVSLTDPERAQIEDIVKRKTEIGAEGIVITLMDLAE